MTEEDSAPSRERVRTRDSELLPGQSQAQERTVRSVEVKPEEVEAVGEDEAQGTDSKTESRPKQ